jgi:hypothetical protein
MKSDIARYRHKIILVGAISMGSQRLITKLLQNVSTLPIFSVAEGPNRPGAPPAAHVRRPLPEQGGHQMRNLKKLNLSRKGGAAPTIAAA